MHKPSIGILAALATLVCASAAPAATPAPWPDDGISRLEALALVETLDADLLGNDSATLTLERWCSAHALASPATVRATRLHEAEGPADADVRHLLGVGEEEPVRHRHVRLACGDHVLSEADNWYLPARLTLEMNRVLATGDIAFGHAVADLHFQRRTLSADLLWHPLATGWETQTTLPAARPGALDIPAYVLRHRAVLVLPDGTPFSALVETYTGEVLAFPPPRLR